MVPRDVSTCWNSTYDMLEFAIDAMTAVRDFDLCQYELLPTEWDIAAKLRDVLKVCDCLSLSPPCSHYFV